MTTPASNIATWDMTSSHVNYAYFHNGVEIYSFGYDASFFCGRVVDIRPESTRNPMRADGTRAPSGWRHQKVNLSSVPRTRTLKFPNGGYEVHVTITQQPAFGASHWGYVNEELGWMLGVSGSEFPYGIEARAITQAINKLRNQKYSFGASLAEMRETISFVADTTEAITNALGHTFSAFPGDREDVADWFMRLTRSELKSGRKGKYGPRVRNMSNKIWGRKAEAYMKLGISAWMAFQFAVKPLLYDIDDARKALGEILFGDEAEPPCLVVQTGSTETVELKLSSNSGIITPGYTVSAAVYLFTKCRINAKYEVELTSNARAQSWGLMGTPAILYEAIWLSWMVDYLTNTGEWLESLTPVEGANFLEGTLTRFQEAQPARRLEFHPNPGVTFISGYPTSEWWSCDLMRIERNLIPAEGLLPAVRPVYRNKMNLTRLANVMGALSGLVGKL